MKKHFSFYVVSFLVSFSSMAQAMQAPEQNQPCLEALQRIAEVAFPTSLYENDCHIDDKEKLKKAIQAVSNAGSFNILPPEIFIGHIIPSLTPPLSRGLGFTCQFFYQLSQLSFFYLNAYCLTERMPHVIPLHTLRFKVCNTKDGLLKLATLFSVTVENLCEWFEPDFLQSSFLLYQGSLPQQLEGQSEEALGALYPILKIALAATQAEGVDEGQKERVMQLVEEYNGEGMSLNKLRLISLNPERPGIYYQTLEHLLQGQHGYPFSPTDVAAAQVKEVIARELLRNGKNVVFVNQNLFVCNPQKKDIAIEIVNLCLEYPQLIYSYGGSIFVQGSIHLGCPDQILKALSWVINLPDDENGIRQKVQSLAHYVDWTQPEDIKIEDKNIQAYCKSFSSNLYALHWARLSLPEKFPALSLLVHAEKREDVSNAVEGILLQPDEEFLKIFQCSLIKDLAEHHYPEEVKKLISKALNINPDKFISTFPYILDDFFDHAIKADREKTVALLRGYAESKATHEGTGLWALGVLAEFAIGDDEKNYILSKITSLSDEETGDDSASDLCTIYYYLGNKDLCHSYFQKVIKNILNGEETGRIAFLKSFQKAGLNITHLEELETMDPFEVLPTVLKLQER